MPSRDRGSRPHCRAGLSTVRCRRAVVVLAAAAAALVLGPPAPASAHPLGPPQSLQLSADGAQVRAVWRAAEDDLTALGLELGVLAEGRTFVYDQGVLVPEESSAGDAVLLGDDEAALGGYLLRTVSVRQGGAQCPGRLTRSDRLLEDGAHLEFSCPEQVDGVEVDVSTLVDLHPAYRTLAADSSGERAVYTESAPRHRWQLGAADRGGKAWTGLLTGGVVLGLVVPVVAVWRHRRRPAR